MKTLPADTVKLLQSLREIREGEVVGMPPALKGKLWNADSQPCDLLFGPCSCGAWHNVKELWDRLHRNGFQAYSLGDAFDALQAQVEGPCLVVCGEEKQGHGRLYIFVPGDHREAARIESAYGKSWLGYPLTIVALGCWVER